MRRVLVSIGCDQYEHLNKLKGAENDAQRIVAELSSAGAGPYKYDDVLTLMSPSLAEVHARISALDLREDDIETLTFFFAGHGCVKSSSFWMCLKDTQSAKLATTAYSLSSLFLLVQELRPRHANIVIDACESGGVLADVRSALRANDLGDADTTGISLLAACAKNQYAAEIEGAGLCTSEILDCVSGVRSIQDFSPALDLAEIAKNISNGELAEQNPVFWGLNLSGSAQFCANPHYSQEGPLRKLITNQASGSHSIKAKNSLWKMYLDLDENWDSDSFQVVVNQLVNRDDLATDSRLGLLSQISASFTLRANEFDDIFRHIEVQASCLCCLLPYCEEELVEKYILEQLGSIGQKIESALNLIVAGIESDKYFLLGKGIHPELFFLPLRISKLLGWVGFAFLSNENIDEKLISTTRKLFKLIEEHYLLSISSVADGQAAYFVAIISGFVKAKLKDEVELIASSMFSTLCEVNGNVAANSIKSKEIISYLCMRAANDFDNSDGIVARPSELVMALLLSGHALGIDDVFDESMIDLDRISINAFIPATYSQFSEVRIEDGDNYTFKIGYDFWRIGELVKYWLEQERSAPKCGVESHLSLICSLLSPNRVCWYLIDDLLQTKTP